jgi:GAF domain-containing protein
MKAQDSQVTLEIPSNIARDWQNIVNIAAKLVDVPAALIMRVEGEDVEVFRGSDNRGNPYFRGYRRTIDTPGYSDTVIKTRRHLVIPDATSDPRWDNNPDLKFKMISYLGYPILFPNGSPFGVICILDSKRNYFSKTYEQLLQKFRQLIEAQLDLLYMNRKLGECNRRPSSYIPEVQSLRATTPACRGCVKTGKNRKRHRPENHHYHSPAFAPAC